MAKNLVIVESPAKAKTINKYLGSDYRVMASIGHIKDLPSKGLGVDVDNNFEPTYEVIPDTKKRNNKKVVADLKRPRKKPKPSTWPLTLIAKARRSASIWPKRSFPSVRRSRTFRVMFNEITKRAVQDAFKDPKQIDKNLVDAQQARRVLDRLVGYKVSPLLWRTVGGSLARAACRQSRCGWWSNANARSKRFVKTRILDDRRQPRGAACRRHFDARLYQGRRAER